MRRIMCLPIFLLIPFSPISSYRTHWMWVWPIPEQNRVGNQIPTFRGCGRVSTIYLPQCASSSRQVLQFPAEMVYDSITRIKNVRSLSLNVRSLSFLPKKQNHMFFSSVLILYSMSDLFLFSPKTKSHVFSQVFFTYTRSDKERINSVTPFPWKLPHLFMNLLYESYIHDCKIQTLK